MHGSFTKTQENKKTNKPKSSVLLSVSGECEDVKPQVVPKGFSSFVQQLQLFLEFLEREIWLLECLFWGLVVGGGEFGSANGPCEHNRHQSLSTFWGLRGMVGNYLGGG